MKLAQNIDFNRLERDVLWGTPVTPGDIISNVSFYIFSAAGILVLIYLISAGFQYMTSQGNPKVLAMARGKITNGLVGLIIVLVAYWIVQLTGSIIGVNSVSDTFQGQASCTASCIPLSTPCTNPQTGACPPGTRCCQ